jgi:hypothetical protein
MDAVKQPSRELYVIKTRQQQYKITDWGDHFTIPTHCIIQDWQIAEKIKHKNNPYPG